MNVDLKKRNNGSAASRGGFVAPLGGTLLTGPSGVGNVDTGKTMLGG